jgi:hypothetical protein
MNEVTIIFKSGAKQTFICEEFTVKENAFGQLIKLEWENVQSAAPMYIELDEISAIFAEELKEAE